MHTTVLLFAGALQKSQEDDVYELTHYILIVGTSIELHAHCGDNS